jgi:branched-subunit amino acid transport protein
MNFLTYGHWTGVVIGAATFLIIGLFHPLVIRAEYYFGTRCWWVFLLAGIGAGVVSVCAEQVAVSALAGVFAFTSLWSIGELFEQKKRVAKGWFPQNPKRKK